MQDVQTGHKEVSNKLRSGIDAVKGGKASLPVTPKGRSSGATHHDVTRIYLSEIGRARLLTAEEEVSLSRAAQNGCIASRQRMIESNLRLVVNVARSYVKRGLPLDEQDRLTNGLAIDQVDILAPHRFI